MVQVRYVLGAELKRALAFLASAWLALNQVQAAPLQVYSTANPKTLTTSRLFMHIFPHTDNWVTYIDSQTGVPQSQADTNCCGIQINVGWAYVAPNGAGITASTTTSSTALNITAFSQAGQQVCVGDSIAGTGLNGNPTVATVHGGGSCSSTPANDYALSVSQTTGQAAEAMAAWRYDWTKLDAVIADWDGLGKYTAIDWNGAMATIPQQLVPTGWTNGLPATPDYILHVGATSATVAAGGSGGADGPCTVSLGTAGVVSATGANTITQNNTTVATFSGTVTGGVLTGALSLVQSPGYSNYLANPVAVTGCGLTGATLNVSWAEPRGLPFIQCHPEVGGAKVVPIAPGYLDARYSVPWKRFLADVMARYANDSRVAYSRVPIGGIESFVVTNYGKDPGCQAQMAGIGINPTTWQAHALDTIDYVYSLSPATQVTFDLTAMGSALDSNTVYPNTSGFLYVTAQEIVAKGFVLGNAGYPVAFPGYSTWYYNLGWPALWAQTQPPNKPTTGVPSAFVIQMRQAYQQDGIPLLEVFSKNWSIAYDPHNVNYAVWHSQFQAVMVGVSPLSTCRMLAGSH